MHLFYFFIKEVFNVDHGYKFSNMMIKYLYIVETFWTNDKIRLILYIFWWLASSEGLASSLLRCLERILYISY